MQGLPRRPPGLRGRIPQARPIVSDADHTESGLWRIGRPVARLLAISLGIGIGAVLLGAAMVAVFGAAGR